MEDTRDPDPRSTLQHRLAVYWEFRSFKRPGGYQRDIDRFEVLISIVGNLREFPEFRDTSGGAARNKPALLPGQFWQVSTIITGNVAF